MQKRDSAYIYEYEASSSSGGSLIIVRLYTRKNGASFIRTNRMTIFGAPAGPIYSISLRREGEKRERETYASEHRSESVHGEEGRLLHATTTPRQFECEIADDLANLWSPNVIFRQFLSRSRKRAILFLYLPAVCRVCQTCFRSPSKNIATVCPVLELINCECIINHVGI